METAYLFTRIATCDARYAQQVLQAWQAVFAAFETPISVGGLMLENRTGTGLVIFSTCLTTDPELGDKLKKAAQAVHNPEGHLPEISVAVITNDIERARAIHSRWSFHHETTKAP